jgi:hypothetical protein
MCNVLRKEGGEGEGDKKNECNIKQAKSIQSQKQSNEMQRRAHTQKEAIKFKK